MICFFKKYFFLILFVLLTNCAAPGAALLSPAVTGIKTKSAHQASLSLASSISSNKLIEIHGDNFKKILLNKSNKIFDYLSIFHQKI